MKHMILLAAVSSTIAGCGGGSSELPGAPAAAAPADGVRYLAHLSSTTFSVDAGLPSTFLSAVFSELASEASAADLVAAEQQEAAGCVVRQSTRAELEAERARRDAQYPLMFLVDAGEALTITTPTGTWPELAPNTPELPGSCSSGVEEDTLGSLPAGSMLHVPGGAFPALEGVELAATEPLTGIEFRQNGRALVRGTDLATADTSFHWNVPAKTAADSRMLVTLFDREYDEDGEFLGTRFVECNAEDTGTYRFPDNVRELMDVSYPRYTMKRFHIRFERRDDVLILQRAESRSL